MIMELKWTDYIDDKAHVIRISSVHAGGGGYHIYVDNYFQGVVVSQDGELGSWLNERSILRKEHLQVIIRMIREALDNEKNPE